MKTSDLAMADHGHLLRSFVASDSDTSIMHFDDLSLHYYQRSVRSW